MEHPNDGRASAPQELVRRLWAFSELLRGSIHPYESYKVILALTLLRRLDCVLAASKKQVIERYNAFEGERHESIAPLLCRITGAPFYNTSPLELRAIAFYSHAREALTQYLRGFSENVQDIIKQFQLVDYFSRIERGRFNDLVLHLSGIDLSPTSISNHDMGLAVEGLTQLYLEQSETGLSESFTPPDVRRLAVQLLYPSRNSPPPGPGSIRTLYDPACGTGGMLSTAVEVMRERSPNSRALVFGQDRSGDACAICKTRLLLEGEDVEQIATGNTLSADAHSQKKFDYILSIPPFGPDWRSVEPVVRHERETRGFEGRFGAGLPRLSDGSLLFLQHMLSKMKPVEPGTPESGSRVAFFSNRSPLASGEAGSGESEIRRWVIEQDWLEAIIALPEQLFFNTGLSAYLWVLTNCKPPHRRGKVQLINATGLFHKLRTAIGTKRQELGADHLHSILAAHEEFAESSICRVVANEELGYRRIAVDIPLRLNFQASRERIERLVQAADFQKLVNRTRKEGASAPSGEQQQQVLAALRTLSPQQLFKNRGIFERELQHAFRAAELKLSAPLRRAILSALSEHDDTADICKGEDGRMEADPRLRESENIPLREDPEAYFRRELKPHMPEGWIEPSRTRIGYEIRLDRYFSSHVTRIEEVAPPGAAAEPLQQQRRVAIQQAWLRNFGPFERLSVELRSSLNVITGRNGTGKTQLLGALLFGLGGSRVAVDLKPGNSSVVELRLSDTGRDCRVSSRTVQQADGPLVVRQRWRDAPPGLPDFVYSTLQLMPLMAKPDNMTEAEEWQLVGALNLLAEIEPKGSWRSLMQRSAQARAERWSRLSAGQQTLIHLAMMATEWRQTTASLPLLMDGSPFTFVDLPAREVASSLLMRMAERHQVIITSTPGLLPEFLEDRVVAQLDRVEARTKASAAFFRRFPEKPPRASRPQAPATSASRAPRVFISYSHDSQEHKQRVLDLAQQLRAQGIDCRLDRLITSPPEGWSRWAEHEIQAAHKVLVVCTETYHRRWDGAEESDGGLGVRWEGHLIRQLLYESGGANDRFIPVIFDEADKKFIPLPLRAASRFSLPTSLPVLSGYLAESSSRDSHQELTLQPLPTPPIASPGLPRELEPAPVQPNPTLVELTRQLAELHAQKELHVIEGLDTTQVQRQILEVRRAIRESGRLQNGDLLCDGRFKLLEAIGHGGFGTVYRAYDRREQRLVAIKVLHSQYAGDSSRKERFFRGARRMAQLTHPGVVRVLLPQAEDHGFFFFVMEYLGGGDLREAVLQRRVAGLETLRLILKTATAVHYAHEQGFIHRDVKPANILLEGMHPKLTDFDLVWTADTTGGTRTGGLGTVIYSAPETLVSSAPSFMMDVFGLGMCGVFGLHESDLPLTVLSDRRAFIHALPCAEPIKAVLLRATEIEPTQRFPTVAEFIKALEAAMP